MIVSLDRALEEVEVEIKNQTTIPKGGSQYNRRRRTLKKHRNRCVNDFLPRK